MKKTLKHLAYFLLLGSVAFTSCNSSEDEDTAPTITVTTPKNTASPGESVQFKITVAANNKDIKTLTIKNSIDNSVAGLIYDSTFKNRTSASINFDYLVTGASGTKHTLTFTITDKDDQSASTQQTITVSGTGASDVQLCPNVILGSYNSKTGSFFSSHDCGIYTVSQAKSNQTNVDFLYFYGSTNAATLASPADASAMSISEFQLDTWTSRGTTSLRKLPSNFDFSGATKASIQTAYQTATSTEDSKVNKLAVGDMIGFQTDGGAFGVARVKVISGGSSGTITMDVKTGKM